MTPQQAIADAISKYSPVTDRLGAYLGNPSVHQHRPAPDGAEYPMAMISDSTSNFNQDLLITQMPVETYQVIFYGLKGEQVEAVKEAARLAKDLFHRNPSAIEVTDHKVTMITVVGPTYAPGDGDETEGRMLILTVQMRRLP